MTVELLTTQHMEFLSLNGGCTGLYESTLVKMPQCWTMHVKAQLHLCKRSLGSSKKGILQYHGEGA